MFSIHYCMTKLIKRYDKFMHIPDFIYNINNLFLITYVYVTKVYLNKNIWNKKKKKKKGSGYYQNVYSATDLKPRYFWSKWRSKLKMI